MTGPAAVRTFQADLKQFAKLIDLNLADVVKKVALDIFTDVVKRTPVATGRARAGWAMTLGTPTAMVPPASTVKVEGKGTGTPADAQFSQEPKATEALAQIDGTQVVFIMNNVAYIEALENGHSQQAPFGMVRIALLVAESSIDAELAKLNTQ